MSPVPLSSRVYNEILGRLLDGSMGPGQVFNRRQIAAELGVSVAPVLEAMLELSAEGLIETLPRKGTRVRTPTLEDLQGQLIVREAVECQAARLYCGKPIERHLKRLDRLARDLDARDLLSVEHLKDDVRFHHYLVTLAHVPALTAAFERVMKLGLLYAIRVLHPDQRAAPRGSHARLVQALRSRDPEIAEASMRAHAKTGKEALFPRRVSSETAPIPAAPLWLKK